MPQVPYQPVPSQVLADIPTPEMNPRIPAAAFGGEVGQALSGLGHTLEGAGTEIFSRALAMQNLNNETEANKADAEYMKQAAIIHLQFSQLRGDDVAKALPKYTQDLENLRQKIRGGLSTDMASKMFDRTSLSTLGRTVFNGAGVAAVGFKDAHLASLDARQSGINTSLAENPNDPILRKQSNDIAAQRAISRGYDENVIKSYQQDNMDAVNLESVTRVASLNPTLAKDMIDRYHASGDLVGPAYDKAMDIYKKGVFGVGIDQIASQVTADLKNQTDPERSGATLQEREQKAVDIGLEKYGSVPGLATEIRKGVQSQYQSHMATVRDQYNQDRNLAGDILEGHYSPNGKAPISIAEMQAAPGGQQMLDRANHKLMTQIRSGLLANSRGVYLPTEENTNLYHTLYGQLTSNDPKVASQAMDVFIPSLEMPKEYKTVLRKAQDALYKGTPQDPRIGEALKDLSPSTAGMNKEELTQFQGAFRLIYQDYLNDPKNLGKRMPPDEVRRAGAQLLQYQDDGHWFYTPRVFELNMPAEDVKKAMDASVAAGEPMTKEQVQADYARQFYHKLREAGKNKAAPKLPPSQTINPNDTGMPKP